MRLLSDVVTFFFFKKKDFISTYFGILVSEFYFCFADDLTYVKANPNDDEAKASL
jgi:hypothetical protein